MSENPSAKPPVEVIPSLVGEVSAVASAHAPFLYFENASAWAYVTGVIRITLEAWRDMPTPGVQGGATADRVIVAHLRMNVPAAMSLRNALDHALQVAAVAAAPVDTTKPN